MRTDILLISQKLMKFYLFCFLTSFWYIVVLELSGTQKTDLCFVFESINFKICKNMSKGDVINFLVSKKA